MYEVSSATFFVHLLYTHDKKVIVDLNLEKLTAVLLKIVPIMETKEIFRKTEKCLFDIINSFHSCEWNYILLAPFSQKDISDL